uniref:protein-tyrosine-phosphatase n=1 Tax=Aceria tosichella TaxID=561515 RepID=A0A6G1S862_9ACAR
MIDFNDDDTMHELAEEEDSDEVPPADRTCDLIGDGSQPYALPTLSTIKHDRFKRIDATTLVKLINGDYRDSVESFTIVDCRYPYEYNGGHIINSLNIHNGAELIKLLLDKKPQAGHSNRHVIIFHCEFSSERGPRLMRFLREKDRQMNQYPELIHPELYLLDGGYRDFYKKYKEYCEPQAYKPMKARNHRDELRSFRKRRKMVAPRRKENRTPDISFEGT